MEPAKPKLPKPVSQRKLKSNLKALSPRQFNKIMAFIPILWEIRALNGQGK